MFSGWGARHDDGDYEKTLMIIMMIMMMSIMRNLIMMMMDDDHDDHDEGDDNKERNTYWFIEENTAGQRNCKACRWRPLKLLSLCWS